ncbi:MAG: glycosyltransferase family 87 protein [Christensenellaceae bacterium]
MQNAETKQVDIHKRTPCESRILYSFLISYVSVLVLLLVSIVKYFVDGRPIFFSTSIFFQDAKDIFMDYFNVNFFVYDMNPYLGTGKSSYPPLMLLIAKPFSLISAATNNPVVTRITVRGAISLSLFFAVFFVAGFLLLKKVFKKYGVNGKYLFPTCFVIAFSSPMLFLIDRANYLLLVFIFIAFFFVFYDSEKRYLRELAILSLAVAVACKIYPAAFGLILLRKKDYKSILKLGAYVIVLFFLPFVFFEGGFIANLKAFFSNLTEFSKVPFIHNDPEKGNMTGAFCNSVSVQSLMRVFYSVSFSKSLLEAPKLVGTLGNLVLIAVFFSVIVGGLLTDKKWKVMFLSAACMVLLPDPSYIYSLTMFVFAFVAYVCGEKERIRKEPHYFIMFTAIFLSVPLGYVIGINDLGWMYGYPMLNLIQGVVVVTGVFVIFIESLVKKTVAKENRFWSFINNKAVAAVAWYRSCDKYKLAFVFNVALCSVLLIVLTVALSVYYGGIAPAAAMVRKWAFSDFGQVAYFTLCKNPYKNTFTTMYLPINFLFMLPFVFFAKDNLKYFYFDSLSGQPTYDQLLDFNVQLTSCWEFWVGLILYFVVIITVIGLALYKLRKWDSKKQFFYLYTALIFSGFIAFGIFRGTNVFVSMLMIVLFVLLKDSDKKWQKELALVALALSGALKLYPLIFGVLLLKQKRWFESVRVAGYFALFALLPFLIYEQPVATFRLYINNLFTFAFGEGRIGNPMNLSAQSLVIWFFDKCGLSQNGFVKILGTLSMLITFLASVFVALRTQSKYVSVTAACLGLMLVPSVSYYYTASFFMVAIVLLIDDYGKLGKTQLRLHLAMYALLAFLPLSATTWYIAHTLLMLTVLFYEFTVELKRLRIKQEKNVTIGEKI